MIKLPNGQYAEENEFDLEDQTNSEVVDVGQAAAAKYLANSNPIDTENTIDPRIGQVVGQFNTRQPASSEDNINWALPQDDNELNKQETVENEDLFTTESVSPQLSKYSNLLKELQDKRNDNNMVVNLARAGNQIAQGISMGHGAKIDDGSSTLDAVEKSNEQPILDYKAQIENEPNDPNSDISKFSRERAYSLLAKLNPNKKYDLENMTATQLEKAFGKNLMGDAGSKLGLYYTTIRDANGNDRVVGVDRQTGKVAVDIGGKTYADKIVKNPQTNQNQLYRQGAGISELNQSGVPEVTTNPETNEKTMDADLNTPTVLNKVNPKLYDKFSKQQEGLLKDVQDSREVATSITNLSEKLQSGKNIKIDSGMLGGIQTQAAKMAGQKGVLTDQDLVKFAGAGGVEAAINRFFSGNFQGEMSNDDIKFFRLFSNKMQKALEQDVNNRSQLFIKNVHNEAKDYIPGLKESNVASWLNTESIAPIVQNSKSKTGEVRRQVKDGRIAIFDEKTKQFKRYEE